MHKNKENNLGKLQGYESMMLDLEKEEGEFPQAPWYLHIWVENIFCELMRYVILQGCHKLWKIFIIIFLYIHKYIHLHMVVKDTLNVGLMKFSCYGIFLNSCILCSWLLASWFIFISLIDELNAWSCYLCLCLFIIVATFIIAPTFLFKYFPINFHARGSRNKLLGVERNTQSSG